jgi:predicted component of type VI protein secretion system
VAGELQQKLAGLESALADALAASSSATHGKAGLVARCADLEELLKTSKDRSTRLGDEAAELRVQVAALQASLREASEASQRAICEHAGASEAAAADHAERLEAMAEEKRLVVDSSEKLRTTCESLAREPLSEKKAGTKDV